MGVKCPIKCVASGAFCLCCNFFMFLLPLSLTVVLITWVCALALKILVTAQRWYKFMVHGSVTTYLIQLNQFKFIKSYLCKFYSAVNILPLEIGKFTCWA